MNDLQSERDQLRADLAAAVAERGALARQNGNLSIRLASAIARLAAIEATQTDLPAKEVEGVKLNNCYRVMSLSLDRPAAELRSMAARIAAEGDYDIAELKGECRKIEEELTDELSERDADIAKLRAFKAAVEAAPGLVSREELAALVEAAYREGLGDSRYEEWYNGKYVTGNWLHSNAREQLEAK